MIFLIQLAADFLPTNNCIVSNKRKTDNQDDIVEMDEHSLLDYINGTMSDSRQHQLEVLLESDPFLSDAIEGLAEVKDKEQLKEIARQINDQLRKQIRNRRKERRTRKRRTDHWGWIFVVTILLLTLLSWWVIKTMVQ